jgi:hypothetical protein
MSPGVGSRGDVRWSDNVRHLALRLWLRMSRVRSPSLIRISRPVRSQSTIHNSPRSAPGNLNTALHLTRRSSLFASTNGPCAASASVSVALLRELARGAILCAARGSLTIRSKRKVLLGGNFTGRLVRPSHQSRTIALAPVSPHLEGAPSPHHPDATDISVPRRSTSDAARSSKPRAPSAGHTPYAILPHDVMFADFGRIQPAPPATRRLLSRAPLSGRRARRRDTLSPHRQGCARHGHPQLPRYAVGIARHVYADWIAASRMVHYAPGNIAASRSDLTADCLQECLVYLHPDERELLEAYYLDPHRDRTRLLADTGMSSNALRLRIFHLKERVRGCMTRCLHRETAPR